MVREVLRTRVAKARPDAKGVTLIISDAAGIKERVFRWNLP